MLTHLSIQGLAIIDRLSIDFTNGFNVITGETGAGKSILIKALSLLLGGKASHESVRRGYEQASVIVVLPSDHRIRLCESFVHGASNTPTRKKILQLKFEESSHQKGAQRPGSMTCPSRQEL